MDQKTLPSLPLAKSPAPRRTWRTPLLKPVAVRKTLFSTNAVDDSDGTS